MNLSFPHSLSLDEVKRRLLSLADYWWREHGVQTTWSGYSAVFRGVVSGIQFDVTMQIEADRVTATGPDPGLFVRAIAVAYLERVVRQYLNPTVQVA